MKVKHNEPIAPYTQYRIGGTARDVYFPGTATECADIYARLTAESIPFYTLGGGSNVLVGDGFWDGAVVVLRDLTSVVKEDAVITCGAGVQSSDIATIALEQQKSGLEFLYLLPGSIGGAAAMNARYDNISVSDVLVSLTACHSEHGLRVIPVDTIDFAYKHTGIIGEGWIICEVSLRWEPGDPVAIRQSMDAIETQRNGSQQFAYPSAGCMFKNDHVNNIQVGRLLDSLGMKGMRVGDAEVASFHANFIINRGNASAADVRTLIEQVEQIVRERTGVTLSREVQLVGTFT